jgi:L-fuculose-phosphate aldolase
MTKSADHLQERTEVGKLGRKMLDQSLTKGTGGNVSVRSGNRFAISPSGVPYDEVGPETVPIVSLDERKYEGDTKPSSETPMHAAIYRERDDVGAVIHTHSPYASTFASLNQPIPATHYLIAYAGTEIPVAGYEPPGSRALGELAVEKMGTDHDAVLLKNHGVVAVGATGADAFNVALMVEYCARIHYQAINVGDPEVLTDDAIMDLREMFKTDYGQQ